MISCIYKLKRKLFYYFTGALISAKLALVVADFAVTALNMILTKCLVKSISH